MYSIKSSGSLMKINNNITPAILTMELRSTMYLKSSNPLKNHEISATTLNKENVNTK